MPAPVASPVRSAAPAAKAVLKAGQSLAPNPRLYRGCLPTYAAARMSRHAIGPGPARYDCRCYAVRQCSRGACC